MAYTWCHVYQPHTPCTSHLRYDIYSSTSYCRVLRTSYRYTMNNTICQMYHTTPGNYTTSKEVPVSYVLTASAAPVFTRQVRFHSPIRHARTRHKDSSRVLYSHYDSVTVSSKQNKYISHASTREQQQTAVLQQQLRWHMRT